jgi:hypothetical protein
MWFDPSTLLKKQGRTPCDFCDSAILEVENSKTQTQNRKVAKIAEGEERKKTIVICYTPAGNPVEVEASSSEHRVWLLRMNPIPPSRS